MIDREALAWAAGFFDGEGCIGAYPNNRREGLSSALRLSLSIGQCERGILERFRSAVGGLGLICQPCAPKKANHRPVWRYSASSHQEAQAVTAMLWPWLGPTKRAAALDAFARFNRETSSLPRRRPRRSAAV